MSESAKKRFKNFENHPVYNKHHTKATKQKMKNSHCDASGENNPNWQGGLSFEPYCIKFDDDFKERVREYWNRKCVMCNKTEKENGRKLCVHHVTYNKDACCDDSIPLFVPLCNSCHSKTNSNQKCWKNKFKKIIYSENNKGKCFYTKKEIQKEKRG